MGPTVPFWALELADHAVTAVRVRRIPDDALEVLSWWTVPVPAGADPVAVALKQVRRRGLRDHGFHVVLPGRGATCRSCRIAPEDADLSPAELERELQDFTPFEPEESLLRTRRLGGQGVLDFRVVAERRADLARVEKAFEDEGVRAVGLSVAPAALLTAFEALGLGPARGYALEVCGEWSVLTAVDGPLTVRYPLPYGIRDAARGIPGASAETLLQDASSNGAAGPLAAAIDPLVQDLRRAVDFHRAAVHGSGEETLLLVGTGADRAWLRSALASGGPPPLAPPPRLDPAGKIRPGPRVRPEALEAGLPLLLVPLGAAASAAGIAPRDLDFRNLPDDLPAPREGTLYPIAAAVLAAGFLVSLALAEDTRIALAEARSAPPSVPAPSPAAALDPAEALSRAERLEGLVERARGRAVLRRSLSALVGALPRSGEAPPIPFGVEGIRASDEGGNYRVRLELRVAGTPLAGNAESVRLDPLVRSLAATGWRLAGAKDGIAAFERLEMRREAPHR